MAIPTAPPSYAEVMASKEQLFSSQQSYARQQPYPGQHSFPMQQPYPGQQSYPMQQPYPGQQAMPQPPTMPVHPSWTFVQPNPGSGFSSGFGPPTFNPYSDPSSTGSMNAFAADTWSNQKIRHVYIQKVYAILMAQLLVTFGIVAVFTFYDPVRMYVRNNYVLYYTSFAVFITTYLILVCCSGIRRRYPWNLILLAIFTLGMSYMAGMLTTYHNTKSVMICIGITALVCLAVSIFSFQTRFDFTSCQGLMFGMLMVLFITGIVMVFTAPFGYLPWLQTFYAGLGALVFTMFLAYDTQLLLGNKRYSLSPEEYVFGALCLYTDIIYIFMFLLQLFGSRD
ncbi:protein lifeguard 2a [Hemiscyllium ocellatum]|uniref:protein lifeguard 2a n=1 Tax=Hemiscyllium ocellatum TaxID=170820 RepID=UPI002966F7B9|nr:protein lifeguard 2a [Hemiscyllium ocellatum]XP_060679927.1 protein lifeguard 2a [Hemiscyllium ocellatum]XP_060679928.1 protein lifeguard 2a [Hemiscyllium ocellatum]